MNKISVIIPTYNGEKTIEKAIKSVIENEYCEGLSHNAYEIEILICDDCSTDNTLKIAEKFPICKILKNKFNSGGPNKGRNHGIRNATGQFIAFLDQDDEWLPGKIDAQLNEVFYKNASFVYSQYKGAEKNISKNLHNTILKKDSNFGWAYMSSILVVNKNVPLFEEEFGQLDYDWLLKVTEFRHCIQIKPCVIRNVNGNNLSLNFEYRKRDLYKSLIILKNDTKTKNKCYGSMARYCYSTNRMELARHYFLKGNLDWKTLLYYLTSYNSTTANFIKRKFKVFG